jgi:hypothetical protein
MPTDSFANYVLPAWDAAMDAFFTRVVFSMRRKGLTPAEVSRQLSRGYGDMIAESWDDWIKDWNGESTR